MKSKKDYLLPDEKVQWPHGNIDRWTFRADVMRAARERGVPISHIIKEFFQSEEFSKKEMGRFALNMSANGELVEGTVLLIHVLGVTPENAAHIRVLEDYIGISVTDPSMWGASWIIDGAVNWPQGTILPASRHQLAKI